MAAKKLPNPLILILKMIMGVAMISQHSQPEYYDTWERAPLPESKLAIPSDSHLVQLTPGRSFSRMTDYRRWVLILEVDVVIFAGQVADAAGEKTSASSERPTPHSDRIRARCKWEV